MYPFDIHGFQRLANAICSAGSISPARTDMDCSLTDEPLPGPLPNSTQPLWRYSNGPITPRAFIGLFCSVMLNSNPSAHARFLLLDVGRFNLNRVDNERNRHRAAAYEPLNVFKVSNR